MPTSIDGLISGLDTSGTITQLMNVERQSQTRLTAKKTANETLVTTYQTLNSRMLAIKEAGTSLRTATTWQVSKASSSDVTIATASASSTASAGNLTFRVDRLATTHTLVSAGTVNSASALVVPANSHYLVSAASARGISKLVGSGSLALGAHSIEVTQSSAGAVQESAPLGTTITLLPSTVEIARDGSTTTTDTISLIGGTYTREQLVEHITTASGGTLKASFTTEGKLQLATTREGSAAKLAVTGGTAVAQLGLSVSASASSGTDAIVKVGTETTTITDLAAGADIVLSAPAGATLTATLSGGLRIGTSKTVNVDLGDGALSTVTAAINTASAGFRATTVQVGAGVFRLQIASTDSGEAGKITSDVSIFDTSFGGMNTLSAAVDAKLTVGSGAASYTVTSSSNKAEVLPGVTVLLNKAAPTTDVTIAVVPDADAIAGRVQAMVEAVNGAFGYINSQSRYDTKTRVGGVLLGNATARQLQRQLYDTFNSITGGAASVGITVAKDSGMQFDKTKFIAAYQADPAGTKAAFDQATTGLATKAEAVGTAATDSVTGLLTTTINGRVTLSKNLTDQISSWDSRLALREAALRRTFSNLEVSLGRLRASSSRLAGEIAKLQ